MTPGRFLFRTVVVAIAMFALGFIGHQLLLGRDYVAIEPIMLGKAQMQEHMPFALISCLVFSSAFVWIYLQGRSARAWPAQGIRFGVAIWAITSVPQYLTNYVIEPWPGMFVAKILAWEFVATLILGLLVAALSRSGAGRSSA